MFLRGQPVSRVPAAILWLCGSSVRSISSSANFSRVCSPLSRYHSHAIAASTPQLARCFGSHNAVSTPVAAGKTPHTDSSDWTTSSTFHTNPRVDGDEFKGICALIGILPMLFIARLAANDWAIPADAEEVDCDTFAKKYLGKIQKIILMEARGKAVGTLQRGALIDGEPAKSGHIVFDYPYGIAQLQYDVRSFEAKRGIAYSQKVEIQQNTTIIDQLLASVIAVGVLFRISMKVAAMIRMRSLRTPAIGYAFPLLLSAIYARMQLDHKKAPAIEKAIPAFAPQVDFITFTREYLRTGKIEKISFLVGTGEVVATLRTGDVTEHSPGPAESGHILVNYPYTHEVFIINNDPTHNRANLSKLHAAVRKEEAEMGIPPSQGVTIEEFDPLFGWRCFANVLIVFFSLPWLLPHRSNAAKVQAVRPPVPLTAGVGRAFAMAIVFCCMLPIIGVIAAVPEYLRFSGPPQKEIRPPPMYGPRSDQSCYIGG